MHKSKIICSLILAGIAMAILIVFVAIFALTTTIHVQNGGDGQPMPMDQSCTINLYRDLTFEHPLILKPGTKEFLYPNSPNGIQLNAGSKIFLACSGNGNKVKTSTKPEIEVTCVNGNNFQTKEGDVHPFKTFSCVDSKGHPVFPEPDAKKTGQKCSGSYSEIEIGFQISTGFVRLFTTCFNEKTKDSLYAYYSIPGSIKQAQIRVPRPDGGFLEGDFYPNLRPTPNSLYSKNLQLSTFSKLLSEAQAKKFVKVNSDDFYIARGHLAAKADFVYGSMQLATFYMINVAPQWQIFNAGNWEQLESDSRNYIGKRGTDFTVITGVWGTSSLPDDKNKLIPLHLYLGRNSPDLFAVPEIYWKVLYEPVSKTGTVFIGHNNPYEKNIKPICQDVCSKINWLDWDPKNVTAGFSYCCDVNEFRKTVTYLPTLDVKGLLT